ncbi:ABC transporter [Salinisphaera orenii MK-B5]|uniref:ABC transporter n=2 Tax=Salinisphaera orenii TaxID=856731 RepID=A0A423PSB2_9GAMM|nr:MULTISPECIES: VacJ family lipoprotein [Salinisphaera]ROO28496.1 ABC transporter [Salinisphaera orenii MK-B5]ROO31215.1 ABC transporter [Salinisphaera halophila YIM 95161]
MNGPARPIRRFAAQQRLLWATLVCLTLGACASTPPPRTIDADTPDRVPVVETTANPLAISDPFEGFNRRVYRFNALADRYVLMPAVQVYRTITPGFARTGVQNFFSNLGEINTFANSVLQAKPESSAVTLSRFVINSTVGLGGLFDPAGAIGLEQRDEDLGQTLGYYGVGAGPYLVLPFFGPSSLRDSIGLAGDQGLFYAIDPLQLDEHPWARLPYWTLYVINTRDTVNFRYYQTGSPFEYTLVRLVYMNYRALQVEQ